MHESQGHVFCVSKQGIIPITMFLVSMLDAPKYAPISTAMVTASTFEKRCGGICHPFIY
jgi:hypothetical protein